MNVIKGLCLLMLLLGSSLSYSQTARGLGSRDSLKLVREYKQRAFQKQLPPGNYSGIAPIGNGRYAVVDDKSPTDGFYVFKIDVDSVTGVITNVENEGFRSSGVANRDGEGIAFVGESRTLWISGERDNKILEYQLDGRLTGRETMLPTGFVGASSSYGLEALTFDEVGRRLITTSESTLPCDGKQAGPMDPVVNKLRLVLIDYDSLHPQAQYFYEMDRPVSPQKQTANYAFGVSELLAVDGAYLLVLERELFVPKKKIGAFVHNKLYSVPMPLRGRQHGLDSIGTVHKSLLTEWETRLNLTVRSFANYEGMCVGPKLKNGNQVVILIADSQNRYAGMLKDWFKTIIVSSPQ